MSPDLASIRARLHAADLALAASHGGSSDLVNLRRAVGCLLVAIHDLLIVWEAQKRSSEAEPASRARKPRP
jgi:hypothetical protein